MLKTKLNVKAIILGSIKENKKTQKIQTESLNLFLTKDQWTAIYQTIELNIAKQ